MGYRFHQGKLFRGREIQGRVERVVGCQMDRQTDGQMARERREEPKSGCICFTNKAMQDWAGEGKPKWGSQ